MRKRLALVFVAASLSLAASPSVEAAGRSSRSQARRTTTQRARTSTRARQAPRRVEDAAALQRQRERAIAKQYLKDRTVSRRKAARFFEKITVQKNYSGEYVMMRNKNVTAFLDLGDPRHPAYDPQREGPDDVHMANIPKAKRVHVLVVPNAKREHIGAQLGGTIGSKDLQATLAVVKEAEKLAAKLKIKNPKVFVNSEANIGVGYLHVHITGERTSQTKYPSAL
jgi:diadenosine tetraphosphate (Ap4A) HIT family hydrolase